jgi:non-specific serine/threonine protein kinase
MQLAREIGWRAGEAFSSFVIADALAWRGEYDRAIPLAFSALGQAEEIEHLEWTAGASQIAGFMLLDLLAVDAARTHLERAFGIAERLGSRVWVRWTAAPLALARSRAGDVDGARRMLDAVMGDSAIDETRALTLGERALWLASAEVMLAEGRPAAALSVVEARSRAEDAAHRGPSLGVPSLSLLGAEALVALERFDDAHALLERARDGATAQDARPMLWRIEAARGRVFRRERRRLEARRAFDAARAIADELAARISDVELRERFQSGLRSLIPATSASSEARLAKATFGGLTRRERDVAQLVAQGKANKHVARALGIGERTVEGYVASALAKLGFQSRAQLAAWAVDSGLHHPASADGAARRR